MITLSERKGRRISLHNFLHIDGQPLILCNEVIK